jgi:hypothetical protein
MRFDAADQPPAHQKMRIAKKPIGNNVDGVMKWPAS